MKLQVLFMICLVSFPLLGQQDGVSFRLEAPGQVIAGNSMEITLTLNKGDLKDYSRFSQDLPNGFTATNINSPNADFSFTEQRVRIIWLKLPSEHEIEVKYSINVHERLSGEIKLAGTFAYVRNGERKYKELEQPIRVHITPNPNINQNLVVDVSEFDRIGKTTDVTVSGNGEPKKTSYATVVRQKPVVEPNGIIHINLLIKKPEGTNFLKLEETIPGGYSFEIIEGSGAVVSQAASLARLVWMKPPEYSVFMVKYRLVPILERVQDPLDIDGNMTFTKDGETRITSVKEEEVNLTAMNTSEQLNFLETGLIPKQFSGVQTQNTKPKETSREQSVTTRVNKLVSSYEKSSGKSVIEIETLESGTGVYFRVQVAAVRRPYFATTYFADYDLLREVKVENEGGWYKYTVGPLSSYDEAVRLKEQIIAETPVDTAFIVAYRDGKRVQITEVTLR
ncbi:MAG: SPOR domain-containing protein [Bacteroidales bacterium]